MNAPWNIVILRFCNLFRFVFLGLTEAKLFIQELLWIVDAVFKISHPCCSELVSESSRVVPPELSLWLESKNMDWEVPVDGY